MQLHEDLPVYKASYDLLLEIFRFTKEFSKEYKYTIGESLKRETIELLTLIFRANTRTDKQSVLQEARERIEVIRLYIRLMKDLQQISVKRFVQVNEKVEGVSKQVTYETDWRARCSSLPSLYIFHSTLSVLHAVQTSFLVVICSFTTQSILCAQSRKPYYSREVCLVADNDIFAFQDYYYTAGQDFIYRTLLRPGSRWNKLLRSPASVDSGKTILQFRYGFKIFTPSDIVTTDPGKMDRLYAGWQFVNATVSNFPSSTSANQYQLEIGVVGKNSGMEQLQEWMHHYARFDLPRGWNYQIRSEVVVNAAYQRWKNWRLAKDFDIVSQSSIAAGTGKNEIAQEIAVRVMQFNDLSNSVFTNSRLSWDNRNQGRKRPIEFFLFAATGIHYVFSNILIEGSLFKGNQTPFATPKEPWVFQTRYGLMFSKHDISYSITMYHLSSEVANGDTHTYFSLSLAVRF